MSTFFVMRRANGEFLTENLDGSKVLPVWPDILTLERYKIFNPELGLYLPKHIDVQTIAQLRLLEKAGTKFRFMSSEIPSPNLNDGPPHKHHRDRSFDRICCFIVSSKQFKHWPYLNHCPHQ